MNRTIFGAFAAFSLAATTPQFAAAQPKPATVSIVENGQPRAAIIVAPDIMADDKAFTFRTPPAEVQAERERRYVRDSVRDLPLYFEKMSGAKIEILSAPLPAGDKRLPIYIGAAAVEKFGPMKFKGLAGQGFRVAVSKDGIGLMGENYQSTSFAIYEVLERLGIRWMMPTEMGEVVPTLKTIALPLGETTGTPGTEARYLWHLDANYTRRIRNGGQGVSAGHALEIPMLKNKEGVPQQYGYLTRAQLEANLEWNAMIGGERRINGRFCWGNTQVSDAVADAIIAQADKGARHFSLSPADGSHFCECPLDKALDTGDFDPMMDQVSITDRFVHFANRIATKVTAKHPDAQFGFLAYVQYTQPPTNQKLHPNLKVQLAPINYCRAHAITDNCESRQLMGKIIEGWGKASPGISYYQYMFNLAEYTAPYPMIHQMSVEQPFIYANNVKYWQPEGMTNLDQILPAHYLSNRMAWNTKDDPKRILDEFFTMFYGAAAEPMRKYWTIWDDAWVKVDEHAGANWAYPRRFTPEMLKSARAAMDEALAASKTAMEYRRVKMQDESLRQITAMMQLRHDLNEGRLYNIGQRSEAWLHRQIGLGDEYEAQAAFSKIRWTPRTAGGHWFYAYMQPPYLDADKISAKHNWISPPLRKWKYQQDKPKTGETQGFGKADFDDSTWKTTDVGVETWNTLGLQNFYGPVWYRASVPVKAIPPDKKTFLWISATDGDARVWVNGQLIPYLKPDGTPFLNYKGDKIEKFSGYGAPVSFDISKALKIGENQITIEGTHTFINELGTGGLLGPVYLYQEK